MSLTKVTYSMIDGAYINVQDYGAKGNGTTDDTVAIQAAFNSINDSVRCIYFPPGIYPVSATLLPEANMTSAQFIGASGMDGGGRGGATNDVLRTCIKWVGSSTVNPVVKFDRSEGIIWSGISIDCNSLASYGLQFMSTTLTEGCSFNTVQFCTIRNAQLDGIILGQPGTPTASPGQRQFYENRFVDLHFFGCLESGIHLNEWNADLCYFETVNVFAGGRSCSYGFWFDYGGQQSKLINCVTSSLNSYSIYNKGNNNSSVGAFGLTVIGHWNESNTGGLYYGVTGNDPGKGYTFVNCNDFISTTSAPSVYIASGAGIPIPFTFLGCNFYSNVKFDSPTFNSQFVQLYNCIFPTSGTGVLNYANRLTQYGYTNLGTVSADVTISAFADLVAFTLNGDISVIYEEESGVIGGKVTIIVTQDSGGNHTITWGSSFSSQPAIPAPLTAAGAKTVYTFVSDGTKFYLESCTA